MMSKLHSNDTRYGFYRYEVRISLSECEQLLIILFRGTRTTRERDRFARAATRRHLSMRVINTGAGVGAGVWLVEAGASSRERRVHALEDVAGSWRATAGGGAAR